MSIPKFKLENVKQNIDYFGNNVTKLKKSVSKRLKSVLVNKEEDKESDFDGVINKLGNIDFDQPDVWIRNILAKTLEFSSDQGYINKKDMQIFKKNVLEHTSKSNLKNLRDDLMNNLLDIEGGNKNYIDIDSLAKYDNRLKDSGLVTSKTWKEHLNTALKLKLDIPVTRDEFNKLAEQKDNTLIADSLPYGRDYFTKDDLIGSVDSIDQVDIASLKDPISQDIYRDRQNINEINKKSEYLWEDVKNLSKDIAKLTEKYMTNPQEDEKENIYKKLTSKQKEFLSKKSNIVRNNGQIDKNLKSIEGYKKFMRVRLAQLDSSIAVVSPQDYFDKGFGVMEQREYNDLWEKVDGSDSNNIISVLNESLDNKIIGSVLLGFILVGSFSGLAAGAEIDNQADNSILSNSNGFDLGSINYGEHFELDFWKNPANFKTESIDNLNFDKDFNDSDDLSDAEVKNAIENMLSNYSSIYLDNRNYNLEVDPDVELKEDSLDVNQMDMSISSEGTLDGLDYKAKGELDLVLNNIQDSKAKLALSFLYDNAQHGNYISIEKGTDMHEIALGHGIITENGVLTLNYQNLNKLVDAYFEGYGYHETELSQNSFGINYKGNSIDIGSVNWDSFLTSLYLRSSSGEDVGTLDSEVFEKDGRYIRNEVNGKIIGAKEYGMAASLEKIVDRKFKYEIGTNVSNIDWDDDESEWNFGIMGKANYFDLKNDIEHEISINVDTQRYKIGWSANKDLIIKGQDGNVEVYANYEGGENFENETSVGVAFSITWGGSSSQTEEKGYTKSDVSKSKLNHNDIQNPFDQDINFKTDTVEESILDIDTDGVEIIEKDGLPEKIIFDTSEYGEFARILSVSGSNFDDNFIIENGKIALKDIKNFSNDMPGEKGDELNLEIGLETVDGDYSIVGIDFIKSSIRFEGKLIGRKNIQDIKVVLGIIDDKIDDKLQKDFIVEKTLDEYTIQRAIYQDNQNFNDILKFYLDGTYGPRVLKGVAHEEYDEETIKQLKNGEIDNQEALDRLENIEAIKETLNYLNDYMNGIIQDPISDDINLLMQKDDVEITWESSDPGIIDTEGNVTRPESGLGNATVTLTANLSIGDTNLSKDYELVVLENEDTVPSNEAPALETPIGDQTQNEETSFSLDVSGNFSDPDGDNLTYSASGLPSGLSIDENTGIISGTLPSVSSDEVHTVIIQVSDGTDSTSDSFDLTIENEDTVPSNEAPTLETPIGDQTQNEETSFSLDISGNFSDPDGDELTYSASGLPSGLSIDENTGIISGTLPSVSSDEVHTVTIQVSDGTDSTSDSFDITIENVDTVDTTPDSFSFDILYNVETDTMVESNSITVEGINQETEISIEGGEYSINGGSWTDQPGTVENKDTVKIRMMSSSYHSSTVMSTLNIGGVEGDFFVTTESMNQSPYVSPAIEDQIAQEETTFNLDVSNNFNDDDGDELTYSESGLPSGLSIDENTGEITGTLPSVSSDEVHTVTIQVSDGTDSTSDSFELTIENVDTVAPSLESEDLGGLDTQGESGSGSITFDEDIANVNRVEFIDAGNGDKLGGISNITINNNIVSFDYTAPNVSEVLVEIEAEDESGNSKVESTSSYTLN